MNAYIYDSHPLPGGFVQASTPLWVVFTLDPASTTRVFRLYLDDVAVVTWLGGELTVVAPYVADFSVTGDTLSLSLTRTGGWISGTGYVWRTAYSDSAGVGGVAKGHFVYNPYALTLHPTPNQASVSPRTPVSVLVDFDHGTGMGVDVSIGDVVAVAAGEFNAPDYTGRSAGAVTQGWAFVSRRRTFAWGAHITLRATVRVSIDDLEYTDAFSWSFDVAERPPSPRWADAPLSGVTLEANAVITALLQIASATLLTRGASPHVLTLLADLALHSEVGQLVKPLLRGKAPLPELFSEDLPSDTALRSFVSRAEPFWRTAVQLSSPSEEREALQRAWASEHTVEQAGAMAVILCHAWMNPHGD